MLPFGLSESYFILNFETILIFQYFAYKNVIKNFNYENIKV